MNTQPPKNSACRDDPLLDPPSQSHTTLTVQNSATNSHTQQEEKRCALCKRKPNLSTRATRISTSSPQLMMNPISPKSTLDHNANYPQMKSLDGFSDIQLGRYCFNSETEFSHRGFRNPRLKLASFSQNNFLKMIIQQCLSNPPSSFLSFTFPFPPLKYSFN
jgi:hypothetical protein